MSRSAIIFGAAGQDGFYLTRLCEKAGVQVTGVVRREACEGQIVGDVSDKVFVSELIASIRPDFIFQLAAVSSTADEHLFENQSTIVSGALNVLSAAHDSAPSARVFIAGSALQFSNTGIPISESTPRISENQYSLARNQSLEIARYFRGLGLRVYFGFFFHHDSPRRGKNHVAQKIASFARDFRPGQSEKLEIREPRFQKEWTFAGDTMAATWCLINNDDIFEAVIGTGDVHSISDWIDLCFDIAGIDPEKYVIVTGHGDCPLPYRSDPALLRGLGWTETIGFADFGKMMMALPAN